MPFERVLVKPATAIGRWEYARVAPEDDCVLLLADAPSDAHEPVHEAADTLDAFLRECDATLLFARWEGSLSVLTLPFEGMPAALPLDPCLLRLTRDVATSTPMEIMYDLESRLYRWPARQRASRHLAHDLVILWNVSARASSHGRNYHAEYVLNDATVVHGPALIFRLDDVSEGSFGDLRRAHFE